ncbi:NAD-dependent malic enzyme [bacterium]|nr:NAD-dependent malic enzyme [bacterium]
MKTIKITSFGTALLSNPKLNKGTAFTQEERKNFKLNGLLPHRVSTLDEQCQRIYDEIQKKSSDLDKHIALVALQNRNETLYYKVLSNHLNELMPIVYTPTVGKACQKFSHIYRQMQGLWITPDHKGNILETLENYPNKNIRLIVVTDNERILGLGDLGAGGMGIPIGKLALYVIAAGIHPSQTLAISLDVGTNNQELLNDKKYLGWPNKRIEGNEYKEVLDEFVFAVKQVFPKALIQWEDFRKENASMLLKRHKNRIPNFNDDIQGTAAVAMACMRSACKKTKTKLIDHRVLIVGAGAAGLGIADLLKQYYNFKKLNKSEINSRIALTDSKGLLVEGPNHDEEKQPLAWSKLTQEHFTIETEDLNNLESLVNKYKPTIIIGTSGQKGLINKTIVHSMLSYTEHPIIFPFSNPNTNSEATPQDLIEWSDGKAIVATGSPFGKVEYKNKSYTISQGNNVYVFPGIGLGAIVSGTRTITEGMFTVAAKAIGEMMTQEDIDQGKLLPPLSKLRETSKNIAYRVWEEADRLGINRNPFNSKSRDVIEAKMWNPNYDIYKL